MSKLTIFRIQCALLCIASLLIPTNTFGITGLGIGVKAGIVSDYKNPNLSLSNYKFDDLKYFGGFVKYGGSSLSLEFGAEYYWGKKDVTILTEKVSAEARDFFLTGTGKLNFDFPVIKPFVGAGLGVHRFSYSYQGPFAQYNDVKIVIPENHAYFGYHIVAGARSALFVLPFDLFVEGKIAKVLTANDPTTFTIFSGGVIFNLP